MCADVVCLGRLLRQIVGLGALWYLYRAERARGLPQMLHCPNRRLNPRPQSKLMQQILHMDFYRTLVNAEFVADDFVAVAGGDGFQDLAFAVGEVDLGAGVGERRAWARTRVRVGLTTRLPCRASRIDWISSSGSMSLSR